MIRLGNLDRWIALMPGEILAIGNERRESRRILLTVRAPGMARLWYRDNIDNKAEFLCSVQMYDQVEFHSAGLFELYTTDDDVLVICSETERSMIANPDPATFTTIADRKARNPELERLMHLQTQNMERRFASLAAQLAGGIDGKLKDRVTRSELTEHQRAIADRLKEAVSQRNDSDGEGGTEGDSTPAKTTGKSKTESK